ncbi:hypothetical protein H8E88_29445 [candidate division KSB1 bacterium]|nr:hypothetical protein [candidate division KSB1 bacterium]MBL7094036.1 hypothetical protein [candidate division KSB1 bacterium]
MVINIKVKNSNFSEHVIEETIKGSLDREFENAKFKIDRYSKICDSFQKKYEMTSENFFNKFEKGMLTEDDDFFDWYAAKRGLEIWNEKYHVLLGISL